jgi:hypothetical protein
MQTKKARAAMGTRLFTLAGPTTKVDFVEVYGPKGPKMTWAQRAKAGVDAKHFSTGAQGEVLTWTRHVVRKNSIRLPSDRDAGTYLFGFPARKPQKPILRTEDASQPGRPCAILDRPCFDFFRTQSAHWILCLS